MIIFVEFVGDIFIFAQTAIQQLPSFATEQMLRSQQQHKALKCARLIESTEIERFVIAPAPPHRVKPQLTLIGDDYPLGAYGVVGIFPRLLDGRLGAPGHDRIQIFE